MRSHVYHAICVSEKEAHCDNLNWICLTLDLARPWKCRLSAGSYPSAPPRLGSRIAVVEPPWLRGGGAGGDASPLEWKTRGS